MKYAIDLRPDDRFWNMGDPGWAYGLYYAVVGAPLVGCATHFCEAGFSIREHLPDAREVPDHRALLGPHRLPPADGGRGRACRRLLRPASGGVQRRGAPQSGSAPLGERAPRLPRARPVRPDRGRDPGDQPPCAGTPAAGGFDGGADTGDPRRDRGRGVPRARTGHPGTGRHRQPGSRRYSGSTATRDAGRRSKAPTTSPATWPK